MSSRENLGVEAVADFLRERFEDVRHVTSLDHGEWSQTFSVHAAGCPEGRQLIHSDLIGDSVLVEGDRVTAVMDWGEATLRSTGSLEDAPASTPIWRQLDRLAELAPEVARYYSIGRGAGEERDWEAYLQRMEEGGAGEGTSIHSETATPERLARLRDQGLRAIV